MFNAYDVFRIMREQEIKKEKEENIVIYKGGIDEQQNRWK